MLKFKHQGIHILPCCSITSYTDKGVKLIQHCADQNNEVWLRKSDSQFWIYQTSPAVWYPLDKLPVNNVRRHHYNVKIGSQSIMDIQLRSKLSDMDVTVAVVYLKLSDLDGVQMPSPKLDEQLELSQACQVLGVNSEDSLDKISAVFRALAKIYHPDNLDTGNPDHFRLIKTSFDQIKDQKG